ncbi:hypothetical protein BX666DRAFT_2023332 [Dichotomocladium elegans]|nr:hypothetical protein BX666DRAFT_2023332 [Dichotomocladium elegans]
MALDFLSSDVIFPSDSSEPKLAPGAVSKLPEPVDWAFHDLYSTAHEKASMPLHTLTDYAHLYPLQDDDDDSNDRNEDELAAFSNSCSQNKSDQSLFLMRPPHHRSSPSSTPPPIDPQKHMRAVLCGALKAVNNSMQDNHLTRLDKYKPSYSSTDQTFRWEDELLLGWAGNAMHDLHFPGDYYDEQSRTASTILATGSPVLEDDDDRSEPSSPLPRSSFESSSTRSVADFENHLFIPSPPPPSEPFRYILPPSAAAVPPLQPPRSATARNNGGGGGNDIGAPQPSATGAFASTNEGKPAIAKSKIWQGLVRRLKKNLALSKSKETQQDHDRGGPQRLKRFFKSRQN